MVSSSEKVTWSGRIVSVQPRIRLIRSFDQRYHNYLGYVLALDGVAADQQGEFKVAVGKITHEKHGFRVGMILQGQAVPISDPRLETAEYYKASKIRIEGDTHVLKSDSPPFLGVPPDLKIYRSRGHRRLDSRTYDAKCASCIWGCRMPVEIIIDQWNPSKKKYRFETFCYGPKSCAFYHAGATRKVPGRSGTSWEEEDWIDDETIAHREPDE
jgi:hypothetical protein